MFAFPKALARARESGKYNRLFELYDDVKARSDIAAYLASDKRQKYDWGIYCYYLENDVVADSIVRGQQARRMIRDGKRICRSGVELPICDDHKMESAIIQ
jgi:hypothetical protein